MYKRLLLLTLALLLALSAAPAALAETEYWTVVANSANLSPVNGLLALKTADLGRYALVNTQGEVLTTEPYTYLAPESSFGFFRTEVSVPDGIHCKGLIDAAGRVLVPPEYFKVDIINEHWQIGTKLIAATSEDNDVSYTNYSTNAKTFYRYDTHDFYFDGVKVGTLSRAEKDEYSVYGHGEYITVRDRLGAYHNYNRNMEESPLQVTSSSEYVYERANDRYVYFHTGSGQRAFFPECTLTPEEVDFPYLLTDGLYYDLQGNRVFDPKVHYTGISRFDGSYALIRLNGLYGIIDAQGNQLLPIEYDKIGDNEDRLFQYGYAAVVKDGKLGFVNARGALTAPYSYSANAASLYGCFARIKDLDGSYIVISAAVGELPERYQDVSFPGYYGCMAFVAKNADGLLGVVGLNGETLVPFDAANRSINVTLDGRVAMVYRGNSLYVIYLLDEQEMPQAAAPAPAAPTDDESWTCPNGHSGNTGKFCGECGAPRPVAISNTCPNCGYDFGDQTPSKFCPECGTKQHD